MQSKLLTGLLLAAAATFSAPLASANNQVFANFVSLYPNSLSASNASCNLCHESPQGGSPWNAYGWGIRQNINGGMTISQAILAMEGVDSDNDPGGATNLDEINADAQPGWTEGPNNTVYFTNGNTNTGVSPPGGIIGDIDPDNSVGTNYCTTSPNSAGPGSLISGEGSESVAADDLTLHVTGAVAGQFGIFYYGPNQISVTFGDGTRCVGGSTTRLGPPQAANPLGEYSRVVSPLAEGFVGGQRVNFQYWHRDPAGPGGTGYNLSDGLSIQFQP